MYSSRDSEKSWTFRRNTSLTQEHSTAAGAKYEVPLSAAVLLGFLTFSLLVLAIMYVVLSHVQSKVMNKLVIHNKDRNHVELGPRALNDGRADEKWLQVTNPRLLQKQDTQKVVARLQVSVTFSDHTGRLAAEIIQVTNVAQAIINHGLATTITIHARLQPLDKKFRHRTLSRPVAKAKFNERFSFEGFRRQDLHKCWFRFRLYAAPRFGKGKVLGQVNAGVIDFEEDGVWGTLWLNVTPSEEIGKLIASAKELNEY